jgi:hypothetical protein
MKDQHFLEEEVPFLYSLLLPFGQIEFIAKYKNTQYFSFASYFSALLTYFHKNGIHINFYLSLYVFPVCGMDGSAEMFRDSSILSG